MEYGTHICYNRSRNMSLTDKERSSLVILWLVARYRTQMSSVEKSVTLILYRFYHAVARIC